jgi:hypothetical protein
VMGMQLWMGPLTGALMEQVLFHYLSQIRKDEIPQTVVPLLEEDVLVVLVEEVGDEDSSVVPLLLVTA